MCAYISSLNNHGIRDLGAILEIYNNSFRDKEMWKWDEPRYPALYFQIIIMVFISNGVIYIQGSSF